MSRGLKLTVCDHFRPEAEWYVRAEHEARGVSIDLRVLPARCDGFAGCPGGHAIEPVSLGGCLSLIAPTWLIENLIREGAYLVCPMWLANWRTHVDAWGFDAAGLREFAGESIRRLCLIDTLTVAGIDDHLSECAAALGVPSLRIPVGMQFCRERLGAVTNGVDTPASVPAQAPEARQEADYAMAIDLLSGLVSLDTEHDVVIQFLHILTVLFAPSTLYLVNYTDGAPVTVWNAAGMPAPPDEHVRALCASTAQSITDQQGELIVPLDFNGDRLALIVLSGFAVPDSRHQYRNVLETIAPILSLSLRNVRNYEELVLDKAVLNEQRVELSRTLDFRDRLLSIIAHDLRGPLGSLGGVLELLAEDLAGSIPEEQAMYVAELKNTADRTYALLEELLGWARLQVSAVAPPGHGRPVGELTELVFDLLRTTARGKEVTLDNEVPDGFTIDADPKVVETVLRNLVSNAVKFTRPGGSVTVGAFRDDGMVGVSVTDTGVGMDEETVSRVLDSERRFSTDGTRGEQGTGLGLLFCQELATKVGATLDISSTSGVGTTASLVWDRRSSHS